MSDPLADAARGKRHPGHAAGAMPHVHDDRCGHGTGMHVHAHADDAACGDPGSSAPADATTLISGRGLVVMRGGRSILSGVDIDIRPREIVTVIGPNGAGKTTLVRLLLGLEPPDGGTVERRPDVVIGYAPQRFDVDRALPVTVDRFLRLGSRASTKEVGAVLDEVGASRIAHQQMTSLSGGELQRVVLARALLRRPDILVLDEPVRGVDYAGEAELYTLIGRLRDDRGLGVLLISHDLHVVMAASDRVICLSRHVCCSGVPETVAQHPEYLRLFGAEAARAFAIYHHSHDHRHELGGETAPVAPADPGEARR